MLLSLSPRLFNTILKCSHTHLVNWSFWQEHVSFRFHTWFREQKIKMVTRVLIIALNTHSNLLFLCIFKDFLDKQSIWQRIISIQIYRTGRWEGTTITDYSGPRSNYDKRLPHTSQISKSGHILLGYVSYQWRPFFSVVVKLEDFKLCQLDLYQHTHTHTHTHKHRQTHTHTYIYVYIYIYIYI